LREAGPQGDAGWTAKEGGPMRVVRSCGLLLALVLLVPRFASAQASITGTVKDPSGAVLPGVTVEAASPALIEKVRTAVTDGTGQYRIVDLRAGTYTVTFTLSGFNTYKREGIELTGSFTASVNADLKVGALAESVTVTGESPVVDTQSTRRQTVLSNDIINAIPAARAYAAGLRHDAEVGPPTSDRPDRRKRSGDFLSVPMSGT